MSVPRQYSLGLNQDVSVGGIQHSFTNELLGHRNRLVHGHAEVGEVIQEPNEEERKQDVEHRTSRGSLTLPHTESYIPFSREVRYIVDFDDSDHKKSRYSRWKKKKKIKN